MIEPFPLDCYREVIAQVTTSVYDTMLNLAVTEVPSCPLLEGCFTATVYLSGEWQGALLLECAREQAIDWAARYLQLVGEVELDDARDCLGEIANVLAGNLKPLLPPGVALSLPSVVQGTDYSLRLCGGNLSETLSFDDGHGRFQITLVEVITPLGCRKMLPNAA